MTDRILRLTEADFDETISFLNGVFSVYGPHDFPVLLPALYQRTERHMGWNLAIRRDGRIMAVVGVFPFDWHVGDVTLRVAGIGGVSTHPECRGEGLMNRLMERAVESIREEAFDVSYLGGDRQRYRYFGWDRGGIQATYYIGTRSMARDFAGRPGPGLTIEAMTDEDAAVRVVKPLHDAQLMRCARPADQFHRYVRNWKMKPRIARREDGTVAGYMVTDEKGGTITELVGADADAAVAIVCRWVETRKENVQVHPSPLPGPVTHRLARIADGVSLSVSGNWQVFNWPKTVDALLRVRHEAMPLPGGTVVVGVDDERVTMRLRVDGETVGCEATDVTPDVHADAATVLRFLFGPTRPSGVLPLEGSAPILDAWCPLPLCLSQADHV